MLQICNVSDSDVRASLTLTAKQFNTKANGIEKNPDPTGPVRRVTQTP